MENSKKKIGKSKKPVLKSDKKVSEVKDKETKIKKALEFFEAETRKEFEEKLKRQKEAVELELRGQTKIYRYDGDEIYEIRILVYSSRIKDNPIWERKSYVDGRINEAELQVRLDRQMDEQTNSIEHKAIQKQLYYRLRLKGVPFTEIYPQIEPNYSKMDAKEQKKFRNKMAKFYGARTGVKQKTDRNKAKKKNDKNGKISPL